MSFFLFILILRIIFIEYAYLIIFFCLQVKIRKKNLPGKKNGKKQFSKFFYLSKKRQFTVLLLFWAEAKKLPAGKN
jgi:hypothetical protein